MGKSVNAIGVVSGKVGAWVYVPNKGDKKYPQIERAYQPNVFNPKSAGQNLQRSKMNVAGQISSLCAPEVLSAFGGRKRYNRSKFVSHLLKVAEEVQGVMGVYCPDIKFSTSRVVPFSVTPTLGASISGGLSGAIDLQGASIGDGVRVITLVAFKTPSEYGYDSVSYADYVKSTDNNRLLVNQPISVSDIAAQGDVSVYVYLVPFTLNEGAMSVTYGNIAAAINSGVLTGDRIVAEVTSSIGTSSAVDFGSTLCPYEDGLTLSADPAPIPPAPVGAPVNVSWVLGERAAQAINDPEVVEPGSLTIAFNEEKVEAMTPIDIPAGTISIDVEAGGAIVSNLTISDAATGERLGTVSGEGANINVTITEDMVVVVDFTLS